MSRSWPCTRLADENEYAMLIFSFADAQSPNRKATSTFKGILFPGVLYPGVAMSSRIYLLLENASISADLLLPSSTAFFGECTRFIILTSAGWSWAENQYLVYVLRMNSRDRLSICKYFILKAVFRNFWNFHTSHTIKLWLNYDSIEIKSVRSKFMSQSRSNF